MFAKRVCRRSWLVVCFSLSAALAFAALAPSVRDDYQPTEGQEGKDVVWVPTAQVLADKMLIMANVTPRDVVIDLGSGDGRFVISAAKRGARALGIEYNPDLVALSRRNAARAGVGDRATFVQADLFETDFSQATVITMFLLPELNLRLRPKLLGLRPGTRIVSTSFGMGQWQPDQSVAVTKGEGCDGVYCLAYLWIVPAGVEGAWALPQGKMILRQDFQRVTGTLQTASGTVPVTDGKLDGAKIRFTAGNAQYVGVVDGDLMRGTVQSGERTESWSAAR